MKRWNGWGEEKIFFPLPESASRYLGSKLGSISTYPDAAFDQVIARVPPSRLPSSLLFDIDSSIRLQRARGQSLSDWIDMRYGQISSFPDGVVFPEDDVQIAQIMQQARQENFVIIPYGGGTSVVGHINPQGCLPCLCVDLSRMNKLLEFDEDSHLATFGAGATGPQIESQLSNFGYTLGHYPQSFEYSTLGGWIATRSSGQQSYHYGRIEDLFAGGHIETYLGSWDLPAIPATAAGPDLRQLILGSEGRLGIITRATVRLHSIPEKENFYAVFFHNWKEGIDAVREISQSGIQVSMLRLSNPLETETTLALSGKETMVSIANNGLKFTGFGSDRCLLIFGVTGNRAEFDAAFQQARSIIRKHHGLFTGTIIGNNWKKSRFLTPYLRNSLWEIGFAVDTLETAVPWSRVVSLAAQVIRAVSESLVTEGESVLTFCHLSHVYLDGASIYTTFLFRRTADADQTLERWQKIKKSASEVIVANGGTISHQHGVGKDHAAYLEFEKGLTGMKLLEGIIGTMDPDKRLNPGKLLKEE